MGIPVGGPCYIQDGNQPVLAIQPFLSWLWRRRARALHIILLVCEGIAQQWQMVYSIHQHSWKWSWSFDKVVTKWWQTKGICLESTSYITSFIPLWWTSRILSDGRCIHVGFLPCWQEPNHLLLCMCCLWHPQWSIGSIQVASGSHPWLISERSVKSCLSVRIRQRYPFVRCFNCWHRGFLVSKS